MIDLSDENEYDDDDTNFPLEEQEQSAEDVIKGLQHEFSKEGNASKEIELKIDKLRDKKHLPNDNNDGSENSETEGLYDSVGNISRKENCFVLGKSNLINLSLKTIFRRDGKPRRCRRCASCKFRCNECQSCLGDKKAKSGCKNRHICLKTTALTDEPNLLDVSTKRLRENEHDDETSMAKGLKLSNSERDSDETGPGGWKVEEVSKW